MISGAVWNAWDTLRIWDVTGPKVSEVMVGFDELDHVPSWLADLAIAVTGVALSDDEEEAPLTLERIRANTRLRKIRGQYAYLWRRFFGELPSEQNAQASLSSAAPASKPPEPKPVPATYLKSGDDVSKPAATPGPVANRLPI